MRVSFDPSPTVQGPAEGSVVSIGVFDGVHLGHQAILAANRERAAQLGAQACVATFGAHPKTLLLGRAPRTLTSLEHRLEWFHRLGIEHVVVLSFREELRRTPAEEFVRRHLVEGLAARSFVLGFDSKFGRDREGTPESLAALGLDVIVVDKVLIGGRAVSSTAIREAVELGDLGSAERMLGRPYGVLGSVVPGNGLGRKLGFPTANLDLHHELRPPHGVYAGWVSEVRSRWELGLRQEERDRAAARIARHPAVANIGVRPTLTPAGQREPQFEVHLLDFAGDLYGRELEFTFRAFLRPERRFSGPDELSRAISADVVRARTVLAS